MPEEAERALATLMHLLLELAIAIAIELAQQSLQLRGVILLQVLLDVFSEMFYILTSRPNLSHARLIKLITSIPMLATSSKSSLDEPGCTG